MLDFYQGNEYTHYQLADLPFNKHVSKMLKQQQIGGEFYAIPIDKYSTLYGEQQSSSCARRQGVTDRLRMFLNVMIHATTRPEITLRSQAPHNVQPSIPLEYTYHSHTQKVA
jgi:hypothetical protein